MTPLKKIKHECDVCHDVSSRITHTTRIVSCPESYCNVLLFSQSFVRHQLSFDIIAMKPRRRSSISAVANHDQRHKYHHLSSQKPLANAPPSVGMSPTSRYNQNLKVLRRHDPSIVSIFDQFSHVCLYHHNGTKWEKKGFEGSMFLFERYVLSCPFEPFNIFHLCPISNVLSVS